MRPATSRRDPTEALLAGTPWSLLAVLSVALAACAALVHLGVLPPGALRVATIGTAYGAMLGVAVAWAEPARGRSFAHAVPAILITVGATGAALHDAAAVAYLATPLWLIRRARGRRLAALGLGTPIPCAALALGGVIGLALAAHMLVLASAMTGYRPLEHGVAPVLAALACDAGAQVLATETFFRGALYNRAQRRWEFAPACALATGASVVRYAVDPLLPPTIELVVGAGFYMTLVGIANAWLLWRFGTLVPGLGVALAVFVAYRLLMAA